MSGQAAGGAAMMAANPYGAMIQAGAQLGTSAIQGALGGNNPSGSGAFDMRSYMDGSGWTVSTGSSKATASDTGSKKYEAGMSQGEKAQAAASSSALAGLGLGGLAIDQNMLWLAAGAVVLVLLLKRRKVI